MWTKSVHVFVMLCGALAANAVSAAEVSIDELLETLQEGSTFLSRQEAEDALVAIGLPALPAIRGAIAAGPLERRDRGLSSEKRILDTIAWKAEEFPASETSQRLSEAFWEYSKRERIPFVFGDATNGFVAPQDPTGVWKLKGAPLDALESLCSQSGTMLLPTRIGDQSYYAIVEAIPNYVVATTKVDGLHFLVNALVIRRNDEPELVVHLECRSDLRRLLKIASREAFVLQAVTDSGEELVRTKSFNFAYDAVSDPTLNRHAFTARMSVPKRSCKTLKRLTLDLDIACLGLAERAEFPAVQIGEVISGSDNRQWSFQGYSKNRPGAGSVICKCDSDVGLPILGQPRFFLFEPERWYSSSNRNEYYKNEEGKPMVHAYFGEPAMRYSPKGLEIVYYTHSMSRSMEITFENLPLNLE